MLKGKKKESHHRTTRRNCIKSPKIIWSNTFNYINLAWELQMSRAGHCYFWRVDSGPLLMAGLAFFIMKIHHYLFFLAVTLVGHFPKSQLISLFCQVESPGKIGSTMKYVGVRRNGGPIQGFGRGWPVIIGAVCLWLSHKRLLGERKDRPVSVSTFTEKTWCRTVFFPSLGLCNL